MSATVNLPTHHQAARLCSLACWSLVFVMLPAEVIGLTIRFDMASPSADSRWSWLLGQSHHLPRVAVATLAAVVLIRGGQRLSSSSNPFGLWQSRRVAWAALLGHVTAFAVFFQITAALLEGSQLTSTTFPVLLGAWVLAGVATLAFWIASLVPPRLWKALGRDTAVAFTAGLVLGIAAWAAGQATNSLWRPLGTGTLHLVQGMLSLITHDVICRPGDLVVGTTNFRVRIAPGCSGYEGIGLILVFLGSCLWIFRRTLRFPQAFLLLPLGIVVIWLANAMRIAGLVAMGSWGSEAIARGGFHSQAGWLAFNAVGFGIIVIARRSPLFTVDVQTRQPSSFASATTAYLLPMLAIVATTMVTGAFTSGFDFLYPWRVLAAVLVLWIYRRQYTELQRTWSWEAVLIGVLVFALWMLFEQFLHTGTGGGTVLLEGLRAMSKGGAILWLVCRILGSVLTVPLAEELAFRGYLIRRLQSVEFLNVPPGTFTPLALLGSSVLFGALHGRWLAGTIAGLLYAFAVRRRGNLTDGVVAHATTNLFIAVYVLITGSWALWV